MPIRKAHYTRSVALEGRAPNHRFNTHLVTLGDEADVAVLAFTTATQRVKAGSCSSPVTIEVRDSNGNPAPLAAGASLDLSTVPAGGALFFSDAACQSAITSLAIPPGMASGTFHFKPAAAGQLDLTVTGVGLAATQSETVTP